MKATEGGFAGLRRQSLALRKRSVRMTYIFPWTKCPITTSPTATFLQARPRSNILIVGVAQSRCRDIDGVGISASMGVGELRRGSCAKTTGKAPFHQGCAERGRRPMIYDKSRALYMLTRIIAVPTGRQWRIRFLPGLS
jgi:hypothetical protein